jgi:hypothetical protein
MSSALVFMIDGRRVLADARTMTFIERQTYRRKLAELFEPDDIDAVVGVLWITMRREEPTLSWEDVADRITVGDVMDAGADELSEPDPF